MQIIELNQKDVYSQIPNRKLESYKGDYGRILLLCGSRNYTGAAALAAMGALRSGAGLVYLGVPECIYQIEAAKLIEPIMLPLPDCEGMFSADAVDVICGYLPKMDAVLVGPGMGQSDGTRAVVEAVLTSFEGPVVVDADGINVLELNKDVLRGRKFSTVLTPHQGEFKRLGGVVGSNRANSAARLANDLNSIVVLKGHETIITDGNICYQNNTGNPGMAVGGCGDVLAGVITGLIGQRIQPLIAAACGVWLHGCAGDLCASEIGQYGMLPSDLANCLPRLLK